MLDQHRSIGAGDFATRNDDGESSPHVLAMSPVPFNRNGETRATNSTASELDRTTLDKAESPMNFSINNSDEQSTVDETSVNRYSVLDRLVLAHQMSVKHDRSPWDFAIEISEFNSHGTHVLRELICKKMIEHRRESTSKGSSVRKFRSEPDVVLSERSCFIISKRGIAEFERLSKQRRHEQSVKVLENLEPDRQLTPVWDTERRVLRLGSFVVKRFKWPASNQEAVLEAFAEDGWPRRIDDPLSPTTDICPKRRLHDTIKCLNRRHINKFIKFRGDGTGEGVLLEIRTVAEIKELGVKPD